jgi:hypothetical protein
MVLSAVKLFFDRATEAAWTACRSGGFVICGRTPEPLIPLMSMMSGISLLRSFESILVSFFARLVTAVMLSSEAPGAILVQWLVQP